MSQGQHQQISKDIPFVDTTSLGAHATHTPTKPSANKQGRRRKHSDNAKTLITRRNLLFGALGAGVVAAGAAGVYTYATGKEDDADIPTLEVDENAVFTLEDCAEIDAADAFTLVGDFELPFGTLVWANDSSVAACLFPTEEPSPLVHMGLLQLSSGNYFALLEEAVGAKEGFEIYDVRATSAGMVWVEAAIMEGAWRIYTAPLNSELTLGTPQLADEGTSTIEVPSIAIAQDTAFWQTMAPVTNENARCEPSSLKKVRLGDTNTQTMYTSVGRMSAPLFPYQDSIVCAPRHEDATSYCDLVRLDAASGKVLDSITLPSGMLPNQIGYGPTGFAFCFENIYDYGDGISNLGTYTPAAEQAGDGRYTQRQWFRFNRTPTAAPCWCGEQWFMVKSNQSVCAVNFPNRVFCSLGVESGCLDWGDYLVTSGKQDSVVTSMMINQLDGVGNKTKLTKVRVWQPNATVPTNSNADAESSTSAEQA